MITVTIRWHDKREMQVSMSTKKQIEKWYRQQVKEHGEPQSMTWHDPNEIMPPTPLESRPKDK